MKLSRHMLIGCGAMLALPLAARAQDTREPENIMPALAAPAVSAPVESIPVVQPIPVFPEILQWTLADAQALLGVIEGIGAEGLDPADYQPVLLRDAIAEGEGEALDKIASASFNWLAEDLRDGRTPMSARRQWFVVDPDSDAMPTGKLLASALETHDVPGVLAGLAPTHPDYTLLKDALAATPAKDTKRRALIRMNMDRWRWLQRDLGRQYLIVNVAEMQLRLTVNDKIIRTYRTIVGKPGSTATPQLAEMVEGIVFNPTWTVPQSIVKGEGLGERLLADPAAARAKGYKVSRGADGYISVVQQPGLNNALGVVKLDMPNPHAIFLHDTPGKALFEQDARALSHGCIRTERALEMAITMAILGGGATAEEAVAISQSGTYTKVPLKRHIPVYITYFTMAENVDGKLAAFADLYERDAPVLASFQKPREANRAHVTDEEVVPIEAPGA